MIAAYRQQLHVLPGAKAVVARLRPRYRLAVASSSPRDLIGVALQEAGFGDAFSAIVSSDDVPHGKPAPDVYLRAAQQLTVKPADCVAVEDSTNGIRAAVAAAMATVAIPNRPFPPAPEALALARITLAGLDELTPDLVEELGSRHII
jgi:HAD superfamily hydrolase (TIGR01509 family)